MDRDEILNGDLRRGDARNTFRWRRQRRKESKREMRHGRAEIGAVRSIPGINRIEGFERGFCRGPASAVNHAHQIEAGIGDGSGAVRKADQREQRAWRPDLGIVCARVFERRQGKNHVSDGARSNKKTPNKKPPRHLSLYKARALSRSTMRASSEAHARMISPSRSMPVRAIASASLPVWAAM